MQTLRRYSVRITALLLSLGLAMPALAQVGRFDESDEYRERFQPQPSLPQSFNGIIRPPSGEEIPKQINTLNDIGRVMQACWQPAGVRYSGQSVTIRISFKRNGEVLGKPMITHYREGEPNAANRDPFTQAVREALVRCSRMPFADKLGAAVAGRPFTFRFVDSPATEKQQSL